MRADYQAFTRNLVDRYRHMTERSLGQGHNPHAIVRITVEKLFGQFTYELPTKDDFSDISNLFILYGDNGSGKTTGIRPNMAATA